MAVPRVYFPGARVLKAIGCHWILATVKKPFASQLSGCYLMQETVMPSPAFWSVEPSASQLGDLGHVPVSSPPVSCAGRGGRRDGATYPVPAAAGVAASAALP